MAGSLKDTTENELAEAWKEILKVVPLLGADEMTLTMAAEIEGIDPSSMKKHMEQYEKEGRVICVGERKLPSGKTAKAWRPA
jgi:predicted ArsR family transcriptional regulator